MKTRYCTSSIGCKKKAIVCCMVCRDYCCYEHLRRHGHPMECFEIVQ